MHPTHPSRPPMQRNTHLKTTTGPTYVTLLRHRDLKPENLLCASPDREAPLKVADFGLAAKHEVSEVLNLEGSATTNGTAAAAAARAGGLSVSSPPSPTTPNGSPAASRRQAWPRAPVLYTAAAMHSPMDLSASSPPPLGTIKYLLPRPSNYQSLSPTAFRGASFLSRSVSPLRQLVCNRRSTTAPLQRGSDGRMVLAPPLTHWLGSGVWHLGRTGSIDPLAKGAAFAQAEADVLVRPVVEPRGLAAAGRHTILHGPRGTRARRVQPGMRHVGRWGDPLLLAACVSSIWTRVPCIAGPLLDP